MRGPVIVTVVVLLGVLGVGACGGTSSGEI